MYPGKCFVILKSILIFNFRGWNDFSSLITRVALKTLLLIVGFIVRSFLWVKKVMGRIHPSNKNHQTLSPNQNSKNVWLLHSCLTINFNQREDGASFSKACSCKDHSYICSGCSNQVRTFARIRKILVNMGDRWLLHKFEIAAKEVIEYKKTYCMCHPPGQGKGWHNGKTQ